MPICNQTEPQYIQYHTLWHHASYILNHKTKLCHALNSICRYASPIAKWLPHKWLVPHNYWPASLLPKYVVEEEENEQSAYKLFGLLAILTEAKHDQRLKTASNDHKQSKTDKNPHKRPNKPRFYICNQKQAKTDEQPKMPSHQQPNEWFIIMEKHSETVERTTDWLTHRGNC